jgi:hypothetical protein
MALVAIWLSVFGPARAAEMTPPYHNGIHEKRQRLPTETKGPFVRIILTSQQARNGPLRHVVMTYASDDQGASWTRHYVK